MKNSFYIGILFLLAFTSLSSTAQFINKGLNDSLFVLEKDTMKTFLYFDSPSDLDINFISLDTSLDIFQRYDPVLKGYSLYANSANIGLPHQSLFNPIIFTNPFTIGERFQSKYFCDNYNMPYYKLKVPYSEINYVSGSKEENYLNFTLGNQISEGLYFGVDFHVESGNGTFINQRATNQHYRGVLITSSRDGRYKLSANFIRNKMKWGENGGLVNDSFYEDTTRLDRRILKVNLPYGSNSMNSNSFSIHQHYLFNDSTHNRGGIVLDLDYLSNYRIYSDYDNVSSYYQHSFLDSVQSFDSINAKRVSGFFGWNRKADSLGLSYKIGVENSYNEYYTGLDFYAFNYLVPTAYFKLKTENFLFNTHAKYFILQSTNGFKYNNNRVELSADLTAKLRKFMILKLEGGYFAGETEFMNLRFYSNHFIWNNEFSPQNNLNLSSVIDIKGYQLSGNYRIINNYVYYSDSILPNQLVGNLNVISLALAKEFRFKSFGSNLMAVYQKVDNDNVLRLPEFSARASVFISFPLFKGALSVHPGVDFTYLSSYYADGYNPVAMVFFVQNVKKIDQQIYTDLFINFKIKRARVFLMYKNINMLFGSYNYFTILHYPQQDPGFKIGLSWRFYD